MKKKQEELLMVTKENMSGRMKTTDELLEKNDKRIKAFYALPWWRRIGKNEALRQEIITSWKYL